MALNLANKKPKDILYAEDLAIDWGDVPVVHYPYLFLRDLCPCAECVDEISGEKVLDPNTIPKDIHIKKAEYIGNYALKITWSDEHDSGIFSFKFLRELYDRTLQDGETQGGPFALKN